MKKKQYTKKRQYKKSKFQSKTCNDKMTFDDCELAIIRQAIDDTEEIQGRDMVNNDDVKNMINIVEKFIQDRKLICYGGTAINNILPKHDQFYKKDIEIPDYDFFSSNALDDAKELANIFYENGYNDVEAKSGVHMGTFKVFVNYIPVADITSLHPQLFDKILVESIKIAGIYYCPPNYLRMAMYLELSRPKGDVSRWEKVLKRLNLLNKHFPLKTDKKCYGLDFSAKVNNKNKEYTNAYALVRDTLINNEAVFFGGYAAKLYNKFINKSDKEKNFGNPDFDVLDEDPKKMAIIVEEELKRNNINKVKIIEHENIGELIPFHVEVKVGNLPLVYIYQPIACHNYNIVENNQQVIHVATIDTILSFYLAFLYSDLPHYDNNRLLCMSAFLYDLIEKNRLSDAGIMKRYSLVCIGKQPTLKSMRAEKAEQFKLLKNDRKSREYEMWFLNYSPIKLDDKIVNSKEELLEKQETMPKKTVKPKTKKKTQKKNKQGAKDILKMLFKN